MFTLMSQKEHSQCASYGSELKEHQLHSVPLRLQEAQGGVAPDKLGRPLSNSFPFLRDSPLGTKYALTLGPPSLGLGHEVLWNRIGQLQSP